MKVTVLLYDWANHLPLFATRESEITKFSNLFLDLDFALDLVVDLELRFGQDLDLL